MELVMTKCDGSYNGYNKNKNILGHYTFFV